LKSKELPENNCCVKCHQHYYIHERKEAMTYTMIDDMIDILKQKDKDESNIILKDDDLDTAMS